MFGGGCASGDEVVEAERQVPPPVSDRSLRPEGSDETVLRPRVEVNIEAESGAQLETRGAAKFVGLHARRCYRLALQKERDLEGSILYEVVVTSNGRVAGAEKMSSTAASQRLDRCVEPILERLRFEVPRDSKVMVRRLYIRLELYSEVFDANRPPADLERP
jgi:outer membrane biosynthesis protein TonB